MTASELIAAIKMAEDKNSLESLVADKPEIVIDKRKSLATLKADILNSLTGEVNTEELTESSGAPLELPDIDEETEVDQVQEYVPVNRLIRNTQTGAVVIWTAVLAKLSHFEEI